MQRINLVLVVCKSWEMTIKEYYLKFTTVYNFLIKCFTYHINRWIFWAVTVMKTDPFYIRDSCCFGKVMFLTPSCEELSEVCSWLKFYPGDYWVGIPSAYEVKWASELSSIIFNSLSDGLFLALFSTHDRAPYILMSLEITMKSFPLKTIFDFEIINYEKY